MATTESSPVDAAFKVGMEAVVKLGETVQEEEQAGAEAHFKGVWPKQKYASKLRV